MREITLSKIMNRIKTALPSSSNLPVPVQLGAAGLYILDDYVTSMPSDQNAIDLFKDQWSSSFPAEAGNVKAGELGLFTDPRMKWGGEMIGGFKDLDVLELGPLEAGHTYMLERGGAKSILAIEANSRAYLKCLITKEILNLRSARFQLGDFLEYLHASQETYDLCVANGVLYHMREPAELIYLISKVSDKTIIWTHYYDDEVIKANPEKSGYFTEVKEHSFQGFDYVTNKYNYLEALKSGGFCGGTAPFSRWMYREDILACLKHFGFKNINISFDDPQTRSGPSFCLAASK